MISPHHSHPTNGVRPSDYNCEIKDFSAYGPMILGFRISSDAGKDFFQVDLDNLMESLEEDFADDLVEKYGSDIAKVIYEKFKNLLNQKDKWETIGNFLTSPGYIFRPQLKIGSLIKFKRRDCQKKWWWSSSCVWSEWKNKLIEKSEWVSPNDGYQYQFAFTLAEFATDTKEAFRKIVDGIKNIISDANQPNLTPDSIDEVRECSVVQ